jgi:hypothetical protein
LGLAADPQAGFVKVLHRRCRHKIAHRGHETLETA